jgi:effector-binding domain-containing protein
LEGGSVPFFGRGFMFILGIKGKLEKDYTEGLAFLKEHCEKPENQVKKYKGYVVKEIDWTPRSYAYARQTVKFDGIQKFFETHFPAIGQKMGEKKIEMTSAPAGLFYVYDEKAGQTDMAAAIQVPDGADLGAPYKTLKLDGKKALVIDYYGEYANSGNAHYAMDDYMTVHNLKNIPPVMEEYVTDPTTVKSMNECLTRVIYIVEPK